MTISMYPMGLASGLTRCAWKGFIGLCFPRWRRLRRRGFSVSANFDIGIYIWQKTVKYLFHKISYFYLLDRSSDEQMRILQSIVLFFGELGRFDITVIITSYGRQRLRLLDLQNSNKFTREISNKCGAFRGDSSRKGLNLFLLNTINGILIFYCGGTS